MSNDQRSEFGKAPCGIALESRIQNPEFGVQAMSLIRYRGERVGIRALRFSEQRNAALNEQRTMSDENLEPRSSFTVLAVLSAVLSEQ